MEQFQNQRVLKRIENLEKKLDDLTKYRWIIAGIMIVISFAVSQSHMVVDILTPDQQPVRIERTQ